MVQHLTATNYGALIQFEAFLTIFLAYLYNDPSKVEQEAPTLKFVSFLNPAYKIKNCLSSPPQPSQMLLEQSIQGFPKYGNLWAPILKTQFKSLYFDDCLSHKRDIFNQIENFHVCNLNMNIAVRILNFHKKEWRIADTEGIFQVYVYGLNHHYRTFYSAKCLRIWIKECDLNRSILNQRTNRFRLCLPINSKSLNLW